ncbi:hypothetical protein ACU6ZQ_22860 [Klebsiella aerogenes]
MFYLSDLLLHVIGFC